jgi:hypothetical protein
MTLTLPPLLAALVSAHNAHDAAALLACFTDDAIVRDEGRTHIGHPAIRAWFEDVVRQYQPTLSVIALDSLDGEPVITGHVSGTFDGSPLQLSYYTGIEDGKIVALKIAPACPVPHGNT